LNQSVSDILGPGGPIAAALAPNHEARPEQARLAIAVAEAMAAKSHLVAEAGTGVGKSFAYLIPAMLRCLKGEIVVIATHTIALQEQLIEKDIPLLLKAMGLSAPEVTLPQEHDRPVDEDGFFAADGADEAAAAAQAPSVRPLLVKGRGNYLSLRRLKLASQRQDRLFSDPVARRSLHAIEDWAYATTDGTLSSLPQLERGGVWDKVQSDSGNCMGRKCPTYNICFYQQARRRLEGSNLLVCNHALFFADLALRSQEVSILPNYQHVVLDEAHNIEDVASEHFGVSLTERRIMFLLSSLVHPRTGRGQLSSIELQIGDRGILDRAISLVQRAGDVARAFFDSLIELVRERREPAGGGERVAGSDNVCRVREPGAVANLITPAMRELALSLKTLKALCKAEADAFELNSYAIRVEMIAADAEVLLSQSLPGYAYWVELTGGDDDDRFGQSTVRVELACAPVEVAPILKERLFRQKFSVTLTSATLATRQARPDETNESAETAFSHLISRLGCEGAKAFQVGSPFDYAKQMQVYVARNLAAAGPASGRGDFNRTLAHHILRHIEATGGGAFVLFTSFATLNAVASHLAMPLAERGFPMLAQGRDGSRTAMLQRFRENNASVLLGAASFWQGVDVRGKALRNVIITKLPFDPPDRPLTQARTELIEQRGGNPFMEDSLPRAIIKFKQGFGRLIRSKSDTGRVVILDPRVLTARYGRLFIAALPPGVEIITD
jgi:ATP-dependent DNA helicase DinG